MIKNFLVIFFILIVAGCAGFVPFQPNPDEYERWSAPGASQIDVMKAMLECGYPTPFSIRDRDLNIEPSSNDVVLMLRCMAGSGFFYDGNNINVCKGSGFRDLSACQSDVLIPRRELSRRLNSAYCKRFINSGACKP
ncbi:hypothetical protein [Xanthomonas oryzae]|uniref:hypothetical protein n=1 Tax=Xanthomonas oryzae TaxID=347 RepID=UPI00117DC7D9|nr:hypothetical protein [Xanthomonas oryzae]MDI9071542.1 hypothetical protein [Xanthomonas oryzae pv. oryzae]MDI9078850.1 hypothetical protein [Xanthomonas oryzae pv. oryzae]MDI9104828.1 hypothetical protein [Xanthomonas oryzae pv. oryzae]MDI9910327.1 hypothetical protein [Xanthomonas oryzae pv. oryzae]UEQ19655.1 hypothetical protein KFK26_21490 [Xanthomonas oryzae]